MQFFNLSLIQIVKKSLHILNLIETGLSYIKQAAWFSILVNKSVAPDCPFKLSSMKRYISQVQEYAD